MTQSEEEVANILQRVADNPDGFVLKPQREGGGNNFYGADILTHLQRIDSSQHAAYVIMARLTPPPLPSLRLSPDTPQPQSLPQTLSEVGIYSVFVGDGHHVLLNRAVGHTVRTKAMGVDEGGVATGYAVLDSPLLYES